MAGVQKEILRLLRAQEYGNRQCADCHQVLVDSSAVWIVHSWLHFSMFVCINCAGVHRSLGVHISKVKSIALDTINQDDIDSLGKSGNAVANRVLEKYFASPARRPQPEAERDERELWIRAKHESLAFCIPSSDLVSRLYKSKHERGNQTALSSLPVRLIDYFVTVSIGHLSNPATVTSMQSAEDLKFEAVSLDRFPTFDHTDFSLLEHISQFSYPEGCRLSLKSVDPEYFSFILTDVNGVKTYSSCLRFYEKTSFGDLIDAIELHEKVADVGVDEDCHVASFLSCSFNSTPTVAVLLQSPPTAKSVQGNSSRTRISPSSSEEAEATFVKLESLRKYNWAVPEAQATTIDQPSLLAIYNRPVYIPKSICIVSHYPFFNLAREFLCQLFRITASNSMLPVERYIGNFVCEVPLPPQGERRIEMTIGDKLISLSRPPKNQLPMVDFSYRPLFGCLRVENVLAVVKCLLLECKIVLISSNLSVLTPVAEGLLSFLFPFVWQGAYIPIIPLAMKDMLDAPVPYLVGIHSKYLAITPERRRPINSVMVLLDSDEVLLGIDDDTNRPRELPPFPAHDLDKLKSAIIESVGSAYLTSNRDQVLSDANLAFPNREHLVPLDLYSDMLGTTRTVHSVSAAATAGSSLSSSPPNTSTTTRGSLFSRKTDKLPTDRSSQASMATGASIVNGPQSTSAVSKLLRTSAQKAAEINAGNRPVCCTFVQQTADAGASGSVVTVGMSRQMLMPSQSVHFLSSCNNLPDEGTSPGSNNSSAFHASEARAAFLRFFVSVFREYQSFLEPPEPGNARPRFNREGFIKSCDDAQSRPFFNLFLQSQMFEKFLEERQANSETHEIRFFDESIIEKLNRSSKSIKKKETPFLADDCGKIVETFTPPPPSPLGLPDDGSLFIYSFFPRLRYNLFGTIRTARRLLSVPDQQRSVSSPFLLKANEAVAQSVSRMRTDSMDALIGIDSPRLTQSEGRVVVKSLESLKIRFDRFLQRLARLQALVRGFACRSKAKKKAATRMQNEKRLANATRTIFRSMLKFHKNKAVSKDYILRDTNARVLQCHIRSFVDRSRYKKNRKLIVTLQSSVRLFIQKRRYKHTLQHVLAIQSVFRMHRFRVSFLAFRDLTIMIQAAYRGFIQRKKTTRTRLLWIQELRKHLFLLWHQADMSLVYRSKFWVLFDGNSFLNMAVHEDEISCLWDVLGMSAELDFKEQLSMKVTCTENPLSPRSSASRSRGERPKRYSNSGPRTLILSSHGAAANGMSFSRKLSIAQESMIDRGITLEEVAKESKTETDYDEDEKQAKVVGEPGGIESIFSGRMSWKPKSKQQQVVFTPPNSPADPPRPNRRDSRASLAKSRLEDERKLLYQYLKSGDDGVKESLFRSFGIENNKLRKRYLVSRVWTMIEEADISSQVVLTSFKSIDAGSESGVHKKGISLPFGLEYISSSTTDHSRMDAEWVQRKRDQRIRADVLSSIRACICGIQISWHEKKKGKEFFHSFKRRPSVEDEILRARLKQIRNMIGLLL